MAWTLQKIDLPGNGLDPSLIDYNGNPAIVYASSDRSSIRFARSENLQWMTSLIKNSKRGTISSIGAEETFSGLPSIVFVDGSRVIARDLTGRRDAGRGFSSQVSDIVYGSFDGNNWQCQIIESAAFSQKVFYNVKIIKLSNSYAIGWMQRNSDGRYELVVAESNFGKQWIISPLNIASDTMISWNLGRLGGKLVVIYFDRVGRSVKFSVKEGSVFSQPETVATLASRESVIGLSVADLLAVPQVSYQINFGANTIAGTQRYATRVSGKWGQQNVENSISSSNIRDRATSINQMSTPTIAYHLRDPDRINFATLVSDPVYDVNFWVIDEIGKDILMPSHKYVNLIAYVACYNFKTKNLILARET
jgi:hypothetical protein